MSNIIEEMGDSINTPLNNIQSTWLTPKQVESQYAFSTSTLSKWRMLNNPCQLKFYKYGKYIRYKTSDIDEWLEDHLVQGGAA